MTSVTSQSRAQQFAMAEQSALNMVAVAEKALSDNTTLEKLVMMEYPPMADSKQLVEVTKFANEVLHGAIDKSKFKKQIKVGSLHNLLHNRQSI